MKKIRIQTALRDLVSAYTRRVLTILLMMCGLFSPAAFAQTFPDFEVEPNNSAAEATPIPSNPAKMRGYIYLMGDIDFYSFTANAGDRVYAATMTSLSSNSSVDSQLDLIASDGTTILENDNDDGSFGTTSSSIAGVTIPANGTYYIRVRHNSPTTQMRPYDLYVQVQSGSPVAEIESNDATGTAQVLPASGWISGSTSSTTDADFYSINLNAGESVFLSLDLDPERDLTEWNGQLGFGFFSATVLIVNDAGTLAPDSEAAFFTVKESGTYYVFVGTPAGGTTFGTYHLSVSKFAAETGYTAYPSASVPVTIPDGPGVVTSTLTIPDSKRIKDMSVSISLTHNFMADLDVTLTSPQGNVMHLFSDIGSVTVGANTNMDLIFNDFNAIPPSFTVLNGLGHTPELAALLNDYFKGIDAQGTWTLTIYDDATGDGGTLHDWAIHILEDTDPDLTGFTTLFDEDFETDDGGFTHSGVQDEWERGTPIFAPITTANSGVQCWKTDLDNTYNASANQVLESPDIDLTAATGDIIINWAMKFQVERPDFDRLEVTLEEVGGGGLTQSLFIWYGADMVVNVGSPINAIQLSTGWRLFYVDVSAFAGKVVRFKVRLITDTTVQRCGVAIDDVKVYNKPLGSTIVASAGAGGTISPSGNVIVTNGANQMFTITPDACYNIADVLVDGSSVGAVTSYTFFNVTAGHTISASFTAIPLVTYYRDMDNDGFGNPAVTQMTCTAPPAGYVANNTDCDDNNNALNPNTVWYLDADNDNYYTGTGVTQCVSPGAGYKYTGLLGGGDCNDSNGAVYPGAAETCNGIDDDCDSQIDEGVQTTYYRDFDSDSFGDPANSTMACSKPFGYVLDNTDCNDMDDREFPGQVWHIDADGDGYGSTTVSQCTRPSNGYVLFFELLGDGDCNDNNAAVYPGAVETCNGIDDDCDGLVDTNDPNYVDNTPPTVSCAGQATLNFNGQNSIQLDGMNGPVDFQIVANDNCGVQSITLTPSVINANQVGQIVPVLITVTDQKGNTATCSTNLTVSGLPAGWSAPINGIGCTNGSDVDYNTATGVWTVTSANCYYGPNYTTDSEAFAQRTLCGDGSITALVTGINPLASGWAGLVMRESASAGAKKAQLMTNLSNLSRREFRTATNGAAIPQQFSSQNRFWLRIIRTGHQFVLYISSNGTTWYPAGSQSIVMQSCIEVGLVLTNYTSNSTITGTFSNVSFTQVTPPSVNTINVQPTLGQVEFDVFPNPTSGELTLDLTQYTGRSVRIETYSLDGKLLQFTELDEVQNTLERFDLSRFQNGMYLVKVKSDGLPDVTRRVVLQRQ